MINNKGLRPLSLPKKKRKNVQSKFGKIMQPRRQGNRFKTVEIPNFQGEKSEDRFQTNEHNIIVLDTEDDSNQTESNHFNSRKDGFLI